MQANAMFVTHMQESVPGVRFKDFLFFNVSYFIFKYSNILLLSLF